MLRKGLIFIVVLIVVVGIGIVYTHLVLTPRANTIQTAPLATVTTSTVDATVHMNASTSQSVQAIVSKPLVNETNYNFNGDVYTMQDDGTLILSGDNVDVGAVVKKFYALHPEKDVYDFLSIFTTFVDPSKPHLHFNVRDDAMGINKTGDHFFPLENSKLLGINFLNNSFTADELNSSPSADKQNMNILDHETSHQWLMYAGSGFGFEDGQMAHYGRWANTGFMRDGKQWTDTNGGWPWQDNGDGTLSILENGNIPRGFSPLSLYFMGLIPPTAVPDLEVVVPKNPNDNASVKVIGTFKKVSISDIIAKYGERVPSYQSSQKNFKMGYILLSKKGESPAQYQVDSINFIAKEFPTEWNYLTYGNSTINAE